MPAVPSSARGALRLHAFAGAVLALVAFATVTADTPRAASVLAIDWSAVFRFTLQLWFSWVVCYLGAMAVACAFRRRAQDGRSTLARGSRDA